MTDRPRLPTPATTRRVVVTGATPLALGIAEGFATRGARVAVVAPGAATSEPGTSEGAGAPSAGTAIAHVDCAFSTEAEVASALEAGTNALGGIDQVVHTWVVASLVERRAFSTIDEADWRDGCEHSMEAAWWLARCAGTALAPTRGAIVFVVPTVGMSGGAGFAMLAAYAEGVRVLAKGCGRQWGGRSVTANTLAVAPHHWVAAADADSLTRSVSLSTPALGGPGRAATDLAPLLDLLAAPDTHFLTAGTLVADGGIWMGL